MKNMKNLHELGVNVVYVREYAYELVYIRGYVHTFSSGNYFYYILITLHAEGKQFVPDCSHNTH